MGRSQVSRRLALRDLRIEGVVRGGTAAAAARGVGPSSGWRLEESRRRRGRFALEVGNVVLKRLRGEVGKFVGIGQGQLGREGCEGEVLEVGRGPVLPACLVGVLFVRDVHCSLFYCDCRFDVYIVARQHMR